MRAFEDLTLLRAFVCIVECGSLALNVTHNSIERGSANPKGIPPQSPGLARSAYPGNATSQVTTPKGLRPGSERSIRNPFEVGTCFASNPQGSSFLATLGFVSESRWDSAEQLIEFVGNIESLAPALQSGWRRPSLVNFDLIESLRRIQQVALRRGW